MTDSSAAWFARAQQVIPGGVSSPVRAFRSVGGTPPYVASAHGATITDVEGKKYVDLVGAWGPAILGHAHPAVVEATQRAIADSFSFGAPCPPEVELAEEIVRRVGAVDRVRFTNSGTEATMVSRRCATASFCARSGPTTLMPRSVLMPLSASSSRMASGCVKEIHRPGTARSAESRAATSPS